MKIPTNLENKQKKKRVDKRPLSKLNNFTVDYDSEVNRKEKTKTIGIDQKVFQLDISDSP